MRDSHASRLVEYLATAAFPGRRTAWGRVRGDGRGGSAGGDREAFGWPPSRGLPRGVSMTLDIDAPGVLRRVPLTGEVERADLHLVPAEEGLWCVAVEIGDDAGGFVGRGAEAGRDLEKQDILLHTIVHDLASPLSGIVGCLTALEDGPSSEEDRRRLVELALRQAHRQEQLIRQILDVFRAQNDEDDDDGLKEALPPEPGELARRLVETLEPSFDLHAVGLRIADLRSNPPKAVIGEETRLERVLANLLDNGLRHAPEDSEVEVRIEDDELGVEISILDRGPGVPQELRGELFQKLRQGESRGKLGLGLYFCRITIQRWGGQIGYRDRKDGGTAFWLKLPYARTPSSD